MHVNQLLSNFIMTIGGAHTLEKKNVKKSDYFIWSYFKSNEWSFKQKKIVLCNEMNAACAVFFSGPYTHSLTPLWRLFNYNYTRNFLGVYVTITYVNDDMIFGGGPVNHLNLSGKWNFEAIRRWNKNVDYIMESIGANKANKYSWLGSTGGSSYDANVCVCVTLQLYKFLSIWLTLLIIYFTFGCTISYILHVFALTFRFFFKYPLIFMCDAMVVGDGVADFVPTTGAAAAIVTVAVTVVALVVTSDLHTAVDSVEFDFAVAAFCGIIFSATDFTCNGNDGWLDAGANGALLLFFTTNFCIFSHFSHLFTLSICMRTVFILNAL